MTSEKKNVYKLFNLPWYIFAIFAVIVMVLLARKIWRTHGTLDVNNLTALKG